MKRKESFIPVLAHISVQRRGLHQFASLMCANWFWLRFDNLCSSCCTVCPVSYAMEVATARRMACVVGTKGFGGGASFWAMITSCCNQYSVPADLAAREKPYT